jgi:sterol desaturase/sphingolipid hydroxylase (fatty acid hydroxylase superfamily)
VHHASNAPCLDKNYGGILIIFDRLFGTFARAPPDEPLRYGLVGGKRSFNPVRIALGEWIAMFNDLRTTAGARAKLRALFGPPGG